MNRKVFFNSLWMMLEKVISIFGLIFVTSFVAKYVGPGIFGEIAYATSIFQIILVIGQLGSDVVIFKRVSKNEVSGIKLINSSFRIRGVTYILFSLPILVFLYFKYESSSFIYVLAVFISCLFSSLDVFSIYNDAKLNSKKNTLINVTGLASSLLVRWLIPFFSLSPIFLCIPIVMTSLVPFFMRLLSYKKNLLIVPGRHKHRVKYTKYLVCCGVSLVVSSLSAAIYPRLGIIMLGAMEGNKAVGIFSVAATLAGSWAFVCNSFITSYLPGIFKEKNDKEALIKTSELSVIVIFISLIVIFCFYYMGAWGIKLLYGGSYELSYTPLMILSISTFVSMLGTISARFIAKYSGYKFLSKKMLIVTLLSLMFNYYFIYCYGIIGAALATLLTEVFSLTVVNYFFKKGLVFKLHVNTITLVSLFRRVTRK